MGSSTRQRLSSTSFFKAIPLRVIFLVKSRRADVQPHGLEIKVEGMRSHGVFQILPTHGSVQMHLDLVRLADRALLKERRKKRDPGVS